MEECKICRKECNNFMQLSLHIKSKHSLTPKRYYNECLRVDDEGICPVCGKETSFRSIRDGYRKYCRPCTFVDNDVKSKIHKSTVDRYGGMGYSSEEIFKKAESTCLEKFGVRNYSLTDEYHDNVKSTSLEKYGEEYYSQTTEYKERMRKTWIDKYGGVGYASPEMQDKMKSLCLEKYGVENYAQSEEYHDKYQDVLAKRLETMRKNHTFNKSKIETKLEIELRKVFPDLKTQYKSKEYSFNCDYYVPSLDLYIEYNGTWTHGGHFFDKNDSKDLEKLNQLTEKSKNSKFYRNAIETWTVRDILKLNTALENNLNYVAWFNEEQAYDWIERIRHEKEKTEKTC